jgi:adenosylhomocysteine nucleosidase
VAEVAAARGHRLLKRLIVALANKLVVVALEAETAGVFETAGVAVVYCGVGKVNAAMSLSDELARYRFQQQEMPLVINFGSAGSRQFPSGALIACHEFVQRDMDVRGLGFELGVTPFDQAPARLSFAPLFHHLPAGICGSGDSFATSEVAMECAVVDMEAYALAKVCWRHQAKFASVKYVTDGADHGAAEDWQRNVHKAADEFLRLFTAI